MKISDIQIQNFKSIHNMHIPDIENALSLVGQNDTGKTTVLDAVRAVGGEYQIGPEGFGEASRAAVLDMKKDIGQALEKKR